MRSPPISAASSSNDVSRLLPCVFTRSRWICSRRSDGSAVALPIHAVFRVRSSRTSRWKSLRIESAPRRPDVATRFTTWRVRTWSRTPSTTQRRNNDRAARLAFLLALIVRPSFPDLVSHRELIGGLLGQTTVILGGQDLSGHRGRCLDDQPSDFASELGQHACAIAFDGFLGPQNDLAGSGRRLLRLVG